MTTNTINTGTINPLNPGLLWELPPNELLEDVIKPMYKLGRLDELFTIDCTSLHNRLLVDPTVMHVLKYVVTECDLSLDQIESLYHISLSIPLKSESTEYLRRYLYLKKHGTIS